VQVSDAAQFAVEVERLLGDAAYRRAHGDKARALVDARRGGIQRMVEAIGT